MQCECLRAHRRASGLVRLSQRMMYCSSELQARACNGDCVATCHAALQHATLRCNMPSYVATTTGVLALRAARVPNSERQSLHCRPLARLASAHQVGRCTTEGRPTLRASAAYSTSRSQWAALHDPCVTARACCVECGCVSICIGSHRVDQTDQLTSCCRTTLRRPACRACRSCHTTAHALL
jgi:hypothetical protein